MQAMTHVLERAAGTMRDATRGVSRDPRLNVVRSVLSDDLTLVTELEFLDDAQARLFNEIQCRAYVRLRSEFQASIADAMRGTAAGQESRSGVLVRALSGKSRWAVLALGCHFGLPARAYASESEWRCEDARATLRQKDRAVEEFVTLLLASDAALQAQAGADSSGFLTACRESRFSPWQQLRLAAQMLRAYRWQHLVCPLRRSGFQSLLAELATPVQQSRIEQALRPIVGTFGAAGV